MNYKDNFFNFLQSDYSTMQFSKEKYTYHIVKIPYSDNIDMLFTMHCYNNEVIPSDKLEYCGFFDNKNKFLYDIGYDIRHVILQLEWDDKTYQNMSDILSEFNFKVNNVINEQVAARKDYFYESAEDYESPMLEKYAYRAFIDGTDNIKYEAGYKAEHPNIGLEYIDKGIDYVNDIAHKYSESYREFIGRKLIDLDKLNEFIQEFISNKDHPIHKIKEIVNAIKSENYGYVHIFIKKDNIDFNMKIDAHSLTYSFDNNYISLYNSPAPDRKKFEELFGKYTDLHYEDIQRIEYRNKIIYEDKNFVQKVEQTSESEMSL